MFKRTRVFMEQQQLGLGDLRLLRRLCEFDADMKFTSLESQMIADLAADGLVNVFTDEGTNFEYISVPARVQYAIGYKEMR